MLDFVVFGRETQLCCVGGKIRFYGLGENFVFAVLTIKPNFRFWWKTKFCDFGGKTQFCCFDGNTQFYGFEKKNCDFSKRPNFVQFTGKLD